MAKRDSFTEYVNILEEQGVFEPEPNGLPGRIVSPIVSQEEMLKTRLEIRFGEIDFSGKSVLDIGAGKGMFSAYAAHQGAERIVALEPEIEGSSRGMIKTLQNIADQYPEIDVRKDTFQDYWEKNECFDVVISNNSINHLDEDACINLKDLESAQEKYHKIFEKLGKITTSSADIVIADATPRNLWNDIGIHSPFINLEWHKHHEPGLWSSMLQEHDFEERDVVWVSYLSQLGKLGKNVFSTHTLSYITYGKFILKMKKTS